MRSTGQRALLSGSSPDRPGRSTGGLNGQKYDRWPVDRKGKFAFFSCQRADLKCGYKYPISWLFNTSFLKEFLEQKDLCLFCLKGWKNQEKEKSLGLVFDLHFYYILEVFASIFFEF